MKAEADQAGRVVIVARGHDAGNWCAVLRVLDGQNVLLCDGQLRTLEKPKKKRKKHLHALPITIPVSGKGGSGGAIADSDVRKALREAKAAYEASCKPLTPEKEECAFVQK